MNDEKGKAMNEMSKKAALEAGTAIGGQPRRRVCVIRYGRGRTGGSTGIDYAVQLCRSEGRPILVADGDLRNPTIAGLYPPGTPGGAVQPPTGEMPDQKDFITASLSRAISEQSSIAFDMGGGDRSMQEYCRDLGLVELCEAHEMEALSLYMCGPEMDDFDHVLAIWKDGLFRPKRSLLVFNEHLVPQGRTPAGAFAAITARSETQELYDAGMRTILMPRLACMLEMREAGLGLFDAAAGKPGRDGKLLDPVRKFMVRQWLGKMRGELESVGALEWMP